MSAEDPFKTLYAQHVQTVFSCAMAILKDRVEAQDVVQDVFIQAWNQADRFEPSKGSMATWLRTVARSRAIDRLRVIRRVGVAVASRSEEPSTQADDSFDKLLSLERTRSVRDALSQLPAKQQRLLELSYDAGLSHSSIADVVHEPLGTVKTHIRQALRALRDRARDSRPIRSHAITAHPDGTLPFTITGEESLRTLPRSEAGHFNDISAVLRGLRALLVDDDAETRKLTGAVLTRFGAVAEPHASAHSALQTALSDFDVLIVDLVMPEADGYAFLGAARGMAAARQVRLPPTIAFTASASEDERSQVRLAGFDAYLNKPVHPIALLSAVAALVMSEK